MGWGLFFVFRIYDKDNKKVFSLQSKDHYKVPMWTEVLSVDTKYLAPEYTWNFTCGTCDDPNQAKLYINGYYIGSSTWEAMDPVEYKNLKKNIIRKCVGDNTIRYNLPNEGKKTVMVITVKNSSFF
jgi:hypothetical protein